MFRNLGGRVLSWVGVLGNGVLGGEFEIGHLHFDAFDQV